MCCRPSPSRATVLDFSEQLVTTAEKLLDIPSPIIDQAITLEVEQAALVAETVRGSPCLFLAPLHRAELGVASRSAPSHGRGAAVGTDRGGESAALGGTADRTHPLRLAARRRRSGRECQSHDYHRRSGRGQNDGRQQHSADSARERCARLALCPDRQGRQTLDPVHRPRSQDDPSLAGVRSADPGLSARAKPRKLEADLVVVDEVSMVDVVLMNQLLRAMPDRRRPAAGRGCGSAALGGPGQCPGRSHRLGRGSHGAAHGDLPPGGDLTDYRQCASHQSRAPAPAPVRRRTAAATST